VSRLRVAALLALSTWGLSFGGAFLPVVLANGIGDLYAGAPSGVLELHVASASVVQGVSFVPAPVALAFSNDGRTLWAARGMRTLTRVDIETISLGTSIDLPGPAVGVAVPRGTSVLVAIKQAKTLEIVDPTTATTKHSPPLPAAPDLVAADHREPLAVAARRGGDWIAVLDLAGNTTSIVKLEGLVRDVSVDGRRHVAFIVTAAPNRLWQVQLRTSKVTERIDLPVTPSMVAPLANGAVVSAGRQLWTVTSGPARQLAVVSYEITALSSSDDGALIYAGGLGGISALNTGGVLLREIILPAGVAPSALAPIPAQASLGPGAGPARGSRRGTTGTTGVPVTPVLKETATDPIRALLSQPLPVDRPLFGGIMIGIGVAVLLVSGGWFWRLGRRRS